MPFGEKDVPKKISNDAQPSSLSAESPSLKVNFDQIYTFLLKPALEKAGCQPFRADEETAAGDIRRDMFFELATADFVVADVSILNANVFYELGVRHAVGPRGVVCVHAGWSNRPFDIAPDRTFAYDGKLFEPGTQRGADWEKRLQAAVDALAETLNKAIAADAATEGSPVYASLPKLRPVDASKIEIPKTTYFDNIARDWADRVAVARRGGHPEDILTLASDVPTPYHRRRLLRDCARALVDLSRFQQAQDVLQELLAMAPPDFDTRCLLALVLIRLAKVSQAEQMLTALAAERPGDAEAQGLLGRVYKDLWRSTWEKETNGDSKLNVALGKAARLAKSIESYNVAVRADLSSYWNGINVVTLARLLLHVAVTTGKKVPAISVDDLDDLAVVVQVAARNKLKDSSDVIWAKATLGELALVQGRAAEAEDWYLQAVAEPAVTSFNVRSMLEQVEMLAALDLQAEAAARVGSVLRDRGREFPPLEPAFRKVAVASGHMIDKPGRKPERFPESKSEAVRQLIRAQLGEWQIGQGDLAVCGGARGADILFAEEALRRGAKVRLMLALPVEKFIEASVWLPAGKWAERFHDLLPQCEVVCQDDRLGPPQNQDAVFARTNLWMLNTARVEAAEVSRLYALLVWDENPKGDGPGGTADFASRAGSTGASLRIINPTTLSS
jgi:tetratricopeptide (TPR) repeat protein